MSLIVKFGPQLSPPYANEEDDFLDAWEDPFAEAAAEEAAAAVAEVQAFIDEGARDAVAEVQAFMAAERIKELLGKICKWVGVLPSLKAVAEACASALVAAAGNEKALDLAEKDYYAADHNLGEAEKELAAYREEFRALREAAWRGGN